MFCCIPSFKVWNSYKDQASKSYNYSKFIWGVLKTLIAIEISSEYNSTRQRYLHISCDNLYFKNWGESIGIDVQLLSKNIS